MLNPDEQQIEVCLHMLNLDNIIEKLVGQCEKFPELVVDSEQQCHKTLTAVRELRSWNERVAREDDHGVRLAARITQLNNQIEDLTASKKNDAQSYSEYENMIREQETIVQDEICKYEDLLKEKAERFRKTHVYCDHNEMEVMLHNENIDLKKVRSEMINRQDILADKTREIEMLQPSVPRNLLNIVGRGDLEEKLKDLTLIIREAERK